MIGKLTTYMCAFVLLVSGAGCATAHRKLTVSTAVLGPSQLVCNGPYNQHVECAWIRLWEVPGRKPGTTAQLTSVGCAVHMLVTGGHVAWECRSVKATRGRWIWRNEK